MNLRHFKNWLHRYDPARKYSGDELPLRSELFSTDQTKEHGETLHTYPAPGFHQCSEPFRLAGVFGGGRGQRRRARG